MKLDIIGRRRTCVLALGTALISSAVPSFSPNAYAADKKNPASKVYFTDVSGEAQIDTGDTVQELTKRSVYNGQGTVIETKDEVKPEEKDKVFSTMVYSNGTGAFFDHNTRVEVKKFVQEPFTPNRTDMEVEPSISQTQAFVSRGAVGLCTSKLVAGSTMVYNTAQGGVNIRGRKVVIEANDNQTKISMLDGESTVRGGAADLGGRVLHAGEQAVISTGSAGQPNSIQISRIPPSELTQLDDKVSMACMAKKTVYFEVKEHEVGTGNAPAATAGSTASTEAPVTAFDSPAENGSPTVVREIVPVEVVPTTLPVQFTISPSTIAGPSTATGG
jgi:hypothetical protein